MLILGLETSCDETAAAIVQKDRDGVKILSNVVASSQSIMAKYGGVIPEQAAREQLKSIIPVITEALEQTQLTPKDLDGIAVTQGPGLIGSLLVGVETAKTLSLVWEKPLIPVNHLEAHFYANWIGEDQPSFPCIGLLVSGGHSDLVLFSDHNKYQYIGGTRDDAAGECFDKSARVLGLPYPGGPNLSKKATEFRAMNSQSKMILPRPMLNDGSFDFSFSGLKTAVINLVKDLGPQLLENNDQVAEVCAAIEDAIVEVLVKKTVRAAQIYNIDTIIVSGGVATNQTLSKELSKNFHGRVLIPPPYLCTDNAVMVASCALFNYQAIDPLKVEANPNLSLMTKEA